MQVFQLDRSRETHRIRNTGGFGGTHYKYGSADTLPQEIILNISNSPSATACVNRIEEYLYSGGFVSPSMDLEVNEDQTAQSLFQSIAKQVSYFEAFALLVRRLPLMQPEAELIPIENLRKLKHKDNSEFVYSTKFSQGLNTDENYFYTDIVELPAFKKRSGAEQLALRKSQIEKHGCWYGEVLYAYIPKPGSYKYPHPDWLAGLEDVQSDISVMSLRLELLENGVMPTAILTVPGEISDQPEIDQEGRITDKSPKEKMLEDIAKMGGRKKRGNLWVWTGLENDAKPTFSTIDLKAQIEGIKMLSEIQPAQVARAFGVPDLLIGGLRPGALGNLTELELSIKMFWASLMPLRSMVQDAFYTLYPNEDWAVKQYDPYGILKVEQDG